MIPARGVERTEGTWAWLAEKASWGREGLTWALNVAGWIRAGGESGDIIPGVNEDR